MPTEQMVLTAWPNPIKDSVFGRLRTIRGGGVAGNSLVAGLIVVGGLSCILGPLAVLGFISWKWRNELAQSARTRQLRSTQVR
jgi:hypothetical protein